MSKQNPVDWSLYDVTRNYTDSDAYDELDAPHDHDYDTVIRLYVQTLADFDLTDDMIDEDWPVYHPVLVSLRDNCRNPKARGFFQRMINFGDAEPFNEHAYDSWKDSFLED